MQEDPNLAGLGSLAKLSGKVVLACEKDKGTRDKKYQQRVASDSATDGSDGAFVVYVCFQADILGRSSSRRRPQQGKPSQAKPNAPTQPIKPVAWGVPIIHWATRMEF
jgi:hypothetical protein